mmetsp:Transcript_2831/g.6658  ORF Transcript_2831/g.6658 Transcript_2831/m.6658 type:complete len:122 (+) Transcript_2831:795-1160(+)
MCSCVPRRALRLLVPAAGSVLSRQWTGRLGLGRPPLSAALGGESQHKLNVGGESIDRRQARRSKLRGRLPVLRRLPRLGRVLPRVSLPRHRLEAAGVGPRAPQMAAAALSGRRNSRRGWSK